MAIEREVAGMRCGEVLAELSDYLDGDLTKARSAQVEAHLHGCDVCERFGSAFASAIQTLRHSGLGFGEDDSTVFERLHARLGKATQE
jgi:anti-sigma factor RsiW